jgi:hypothetical protein
MTDLYPGYNVDPRVRKVIDRCLSVGIKDFHKPYANKPVLYKFTTLERDLCIPAKLPKTREEQRKQLLKGSQPGKVIITSKPNPKSKQPKQPKQPKQKN